MTGHSKKIGDDALSVTPQNVKTNPKLPENLDLLFIKLGHINATEIQSAVDFATNLLKNPPK